MNETLFAFLQAFDDDEAPDGAWQAKIEDGVVAWNEDNNKDLNPFNTFLNYVEEHENRENQSAYNFISTREDT